jgi:Ser/Thr protein kinase RdoA (MazF antagonist)
MNKFHKEIFDQFQTGTAFLSATPLGEGHINDTYLIKTHGPGQDFVLQRLNRHIFWNIPQLVTNKVKVTEHIFEKLNQEGEESPENVAVRFIAARDGQYFFRDDKGEYWNLMTYIPDTITHLRVTDRHIAREGGRAIGAFQRYLQDLPVNSLFETIPGFHDLNRRLDKFDMIVSEDPVGLVGERMAEIAAVRERREEMGYLIALLEEGTIPQRIAHNDAKISNVLFSEEGKALSMIDLDTTMPGSALYDFGDAIRAGANTGEEDDRHLERVSLDIRLFQAFAEGYRRETREFLTEAEIENLAFSSRFITFEQYLRFLTDYLEGDVYYKIKYPGHNLHRSWAQLKLLQSMEAQYEKMRAVVNEIMD